MDEKVIIQTIIEQIKRGELTLDQVPTQWRVKVEEKMAQDNTTPS
jgi:hypothetical protein